MRFIGNCPHCGARLELAARPGPLLECSSCSGRCMVALPEDDVPAGDVPITLVPWKEERAIESWLEARRLRRPVLVALLGICGAALYFLVLGLLYLLLPESDFTGVMTMGVVALLGLLLTLPFVIGLSFLVVWLLLGRGKTVPALDRRSVLAVTVGFMVLPCTGLVVLGLRTLFELEAPALRLARWSEVGLGDLVACLLAGWITVRLAPGAPYRHSLGVGLVLTFIAVFLMLALVWSEPRLALASLAYLLYVPVLLLGSWLGLNVGRRPESGQAA